MADFPNSTTAPEIPQAVAETAPGRLPDITYRFII
jgi:hypothetical protein